MPRLTREEILAADIPEREVEVSEWGGSVLVRGMSAGERLRIMEQITDDSDEIDLQEAQLMAMIHGVVDPEFSRDDIEVLNNLSSAAIDKITTAYLELSGVQTEDLQEARKN